jgi:hypothetical protein
LNNVEPASVDEVITVPSYERKKKGGRKILSESLPRVEVSMILRNQRSSVPVVVN